MYPIQDQGGAGAYPSCPRVKDTQVSGRWEEAGVPGEDRKVRDLRLRGYHFTAFASWD